MRNDYNNALGDGLKASINVDVPDRVYVNLFFTIFLAAMTAGVSVAIVQKFINK
jgi:hypothetical protein